METVMNDQQFEAMLAVATRIAESLEGIAIDTENIYSILVELRVDYQNVNGLETDEEMIDGLMKMAREFKKKHEKLDDDVDFGGV